MPPSGPVTLLDAQLIALSATPQRGPNPLDEAIEQHDVLTRESVEREGGSILEMLPGHALAAFPTAAAAARAATALQRMLVSDPQAALRVRSAVHTGFCQERGASFVGAAVRRARHLASVAYGGQILVSAPASLLLRESGESFEMRDLGLHRLKDLGPPEHVFQLVIQDLRTDYPAIRSLDHPDLPNNLPTMVSPLVGRVDELADVLRLLGEARLVTLTGAGGAGKTRLSIHAAAESLDGGVGDGAWLVELAPVSDEQRVPFAIVTALEIPESGTDSLELLVRSLAMQETLLLLDNCEHVIDRVAKVADVLLRECPGVRILATSREPLGVDGERIYRVPSLSLPAEDVVSLDESARSDAVELFLGRAMLVGATVADSDGPLVASVCRRLDGIPLAIELAAARLTSLSLAEMNERLDERFRLLTGGARSAMARQQTLQALVDWSYELLNPSERSVLQRLSAFHGSFDLMAAQTVCAGDHLDDLDVINLIHSLVQKSLVIAEQGAGVTRYRLLETIRQYGAAELLRDAGARGVLDVRDRHADYYLAVARRAAPGLQGPEVGTWLADLEDDADNLRAAISHLVDHRPGDVLELIGSIERFFTLKGSVDIIPPTLMAVSSVDHSDPFLAELVSAALIAICRMTAWHLIGQPGAMEASAKYILRAEDLAKGTRRFDLEAKALIYRMHLDLYRGDLDDAIEHLRVAEEIARRCRLDSILCDVIISSLHPLLVEHQGTTVEQWHERAEEAMDAAERVDDLTMIGQLKFWQATQALREGRVEDSRRLFEETLDLAHRIGAHDGAATNNFLIVCLVQEDYEAAVPPLRKCLRRMRRSGFRTNSGDLIASSACIATARGEHVSGAQLHGAADELRKPAYRTGELFRTTSDVAMEHASIGRSRTAISDAEYGKAYTEGAGFTVSQACDLALAILT
jgi:predicted ATPase/class 3 adenylate cyclase